MKIQQMMETTKAQLTAWMDTTHVPYDHNQPLNNLKTTAILATLFGQNLIKFLSCLLTCISVYDDYLVSFQANDVWNCPFL